MEKGRVLIVEDEKHLADGLRFNLEAEGYEVETVDNGEDALAKTAFDLILLDVMLPGMNGFEVAQALRARGEIVPIFDPRRDSWREHFHWVGARVHGITAKGRATLNALSFNRPLAVAIREEETLRFRHPPPGHS